MRPATLFVTAALLLLVSALSGAAVPDRLNSRVEPVVLGTPSGRGDPTATPENAGFQVFVRNAANAPLSSKPVVLDFSRSAVRLAGVQDGGTTVDCVARTLSRLTLPSGMATFQPRFGGFDDRAVVDVFADGVNLGTVFARSTDLDAVDGKTGLGDLVRFSQALLVEPSGHPECDFDASGGKLSLTDLSILAAELLSGAEISYCP